MAKFPGSVAKIRLKVPLVGLDIEVPCALGGHDGLYDFTCAAFASRLAADEVGYGLYFINGIRRADAAAACDHDRDVRKVISEVHYFVSLKTVPPAEVVEVIDLGAGTHVDILRFDSAGREALADAFGAASRYDCKTVAFEEGHSQCEAVLGIEGAVEFAVKVCEDSAVGKDSVNVEGEGFDVMEIVHN